MEIETRNILDRATAKGIEALEMEGIRARQECHSERQKLETFMEMGRKQEQELNDLKTCVQKLIRVQGDYNMGVYRSWQGMQEMINRLAAHKGPFTKADRLLLAEDIQAHAADIQDACTEFKARCDEVNPDGV